MMATDKKLKGQPSAIDWGRRMPKPEKFYHKAVVLADESHRFIGNRCG